MEGNTTDNSYILVCYEGDWADEMDVYGYSIESVNGWELTKQAVKEYFDKDSDRELCHCVGTNEHITYSDYNSWLSDYRTFPIPNEIVLDYLKSIPNFSGHFFDPYWNAPNALSIKDKQVLRYLYLHLHKYLTNEAKDILYYWKHWEECRDTTREVKIRRLKLLGK